MDNALEGLPKRLEMNEMELDNIKKQFETAKVDVERLKKHTPELALLLAVAVCAAAALAAVRGVREVWAFLEDLLAAVEISSTLFLPLLKTAGIAVVTRIGADLCRDAGESAVASAVEMAGAMGALLAVLPLMQAAWEVLRSLL